MQNHRRKTKKTKTCTYSDKKKTDNMGNFYPRVINKTDITFTNYELTLLNKGLNMILITNITIG